MNKRSRPALLSTVLLLLPLSAFAQSITTGPVTPVPVGNPWVLLALATALIGGAAWMLRRQSRALRSATALGLLAAAAWWGPSIGGQIVSIFTNPAGETLAIPVAQITAGGDVEGFQPADFTNGSGVALLVTSIDAPQFSECFPGGLSGELLAPGAPVPSPHPACMTGGTLADGATCRVDVDAICRDAALGNLATFAAIDPVSGTTLGGTAVTLTGTNLSGATGVTFDGVAATGVTPVNATTVTAITPAHAAGAVDVVVSTPAGSATLANGYTYVVLPTLTSVNPGAGTASGGTGITLTGTGLTGATGVTFDGVAATSVNVVNSTTVTAVTPAHAAGVVDVVITVPSGSATQVNGYTYVATAVGQPSGGGTIAVLDGGLLNLIAATADNSAGIEWGGFGVVTSAQSDTDGAANTTTIVAALGNNGGTPYAAQLCSAFEVDSQGNTPCQVGNACYNDWFLPARNQLNGLFTNRVTIGGFTNDAYSSSTEFSAAPTTSAWAQVFLSGLQTSVSKANVTRVRCVRPITP